MVAKITLEIKLIKITMKMPSLMIHVSRTSTVIVIVMKTKKINACKHKTKNKKKYLTNSNLNITTMKSYKSRSKMSPIKEESHPLS